MAAPSNIEPVPGPAAGQSVGSHGHKTLTRFTIETEHENRHRNPTGEFSALLNAVATAAKIISNQVNRGALLSPAPDGADLRSLMERVANEVMIGQTDWAGNLAGIASMTLEEVYPIPARYRRGKYLLVFDPLDGSASIAENLAAGTIFSILRSPDRGAAPATEAGFCQAGVEQVCSGLALYGPSTMLVLTTGSGVDGFTLDREIGAFILTHPQMRIPGETTEFAINASNERHWEPPVRRYVRECLAGVTGPRGKDFNTRWVASLAVEAFRILTSGGVFLYPADSRGETTPSRLRLVYQVNPIAFLVEQAGGLASTGRERVMSVEPAALHQRMALVFGSRSEVERIERYHLEHVIANEREFDASLFNSRSLFRT